jgi:hypothetical protein
VLQDGTDKGMNAKKWFNYAPNSKKLKKFQKIFKKML